MPWSGIRPLVGTRLADCPERQWKMGDVAAVSGARPQIRAYDTSHAAALAGVPLRTLYHWAREELVAPSVSVTGEKLWSYRDLLMLRLVRWFRTDKPEVARIMTARVRGTLDDLGDDVWWSIGGVATSRRSR